MSIKDELIAYKQDSNPLKDRFLAFIKDKSVPLNERWETYLEAPREFLEHHFWVVHFDSEKLLESGEISWYDDFGADRGVTVSGADIIDRMEDSIEFEDDVYTPEIVAAFKEEILQKGLGSFDYDW